VEEGEESVIIIIAMLVEEALIAVVVGVPSFEVFGKFCFAGVRKW
jgi:hypothetical protein